MLSVKAREAVDTVFKVFSMTQLRIIPSLLCTKLVVNFVNLGSVLYITKPYLS